MIWYYKLLNLGAILFCLIFIRYNWYRLKYFLQVFQQLGYKHNEYWQWLKENWDTKVIPSSLATLNVLIFLMLWFDEWVYEHLTITSVSVFFFILSSYWFGSIKVYKADKVKKPLVFTPRVIRLTIPFVLGVALFPGFFSWLSFSGMIPYYQIPLPNYYAGLLSFDLLLLTFGWAFGTILVPFLLFVASFLTRPVERYIQRGFKKQARRKLESMPELKVVAITGSYGKTSTKFMLRDLLKERFNVCSTPGSYNTPMGICKVINNDLEANHQVLILEMGARYEGNIQELCDIAQPDIAVITNVGVAHLETFGSKEVIATEKGTLVDNLLDGGVAVLNADDELVRLMGNNRPDIERIMTGLNEGEIRGSEISYDTSGMQFQVEINGNSETFKTKLLGAHNVQNLLLAIGVAHHFGIRLKTMALAASRIEPVEHRLELKRNGDLIVIDDAFNSNPVGARNAVEILGQFNSGNRIIITPGMIELGDIEYEENRKFGEAIARASLDLVILVGEERAQPILKGIEVANGEMQNVQVVNSLFEANDLVKEHASSGDIILYENDLPDVYNEE
ncbi:MAG: UDP-N-acetylmuramoyl-tripeptide--D-alanyl-D-alanine ligase [Balneolaceae bacterium]|nr:UDP-N-acetylmuramoyl-tripeptide--D-alanyl-D-alanine ligase [Balneolaceae bacterium]